MLWVLRYGQLPLTTDDSPGELYTLEHGLNVRCPPFLFQGAL